MKILDAPEIPMAGSHKEQSTFRGLAAESSDHAMDPAVKPREVELHGVRKSRILDWRFVPLILFGLLIIFFWRGLSLDPQNLPSVQINKPMPAFQLPILGVAEKQFVSKAMQGQISLLNVWASWCEACREEQVFLLQLAREGVPIYGINYKDITHDAMHWLSEWGNPYKIIGEDIAGRAAIDLGVYGAPETFLIDQKGIIRYRHAGVLNARIWQRDFMPRIRALEEKI
jgi:cytochrome c biogenesis protein CcmG/thiol:disulfide interchange protein DsbE